MTSSVKRSTSVMPPSVFPSLPSGGGDLVPMAAPLRRSRSISDLAHALAPPGNNVLRWRAAWRVGSATGKVLNEIGEMKPGWSGFLPYAAQLDNQPVHLKIHLAIPGSEKPSGDFAREVQLARRLGERGLGPRVLHASASRQFMVSELISEEHGAWEQAAQLPKRPAMLRALAKLHELDRQDSPQHVDVDALASHFETELKRLSGEDAADPRLPLLKQKVASLLAQLGTMTFHAALLHGDPMQLNLLYSKDRVWIIDCDGMAHGDPMTNLAYLAFHIGYGVKEMPDLVREYREDASGEDIVRAQSYLTLTYAQRFVATAIGMPWDDPTKKAESLAKLWEQFSDGLTRVLAPSA